MLGYNPKRKALVERAMKPVEKMLREMYDEGKDLTKIKLRKYQKTHFSSCTCGQCTRAKMKKDPHLRGILEDGFKVYMGEGASDD
ncbi:MAG: hypothetical protein IID61_01095 [SAR324 cluster bacterium]|nr:hypothetical protein [SAR324 cluster bacterium]